MSRLGSLIKKNGSKVKNRLLGRGKRYIPFLVLWVGTRCTLRCVNCGNLIPYVKPESFDYKDILDDLERIHSAVKIKSLQIQGGEPFTHPNIDKIIEGASKIGIPNIEISTNGTLFLKDNVIDALKRAEKIIVRISNYECVKNSASLAEQLKKNGIPCSYYDFMYGDGSWFNTGGVKEKRSDDDEVKRIWKRCPNKDCVTLIDGTLTTCGKIYSIRQIYNDASCNDYEEVDVRSSVSSLKNEIHDFYKNRNKYREACRYCIVPSEKIPAAIQIIDTQDYDKEPSE